MLNLTRAEFYKLSKSRTFYVCCLLGIAMSLIMAATLGLMQEMMKALTPEVLEKMGGMGFNMGVGNSIDSINVELSGASLLSQTFTGNSIQVLMAIFISVFVATEFSCGAMKNIAAKGFSRTKIYLSKLTAVSLGSIALMLISCVASVLCGTIFWGFGDGIELKGLLIFLGMQLLMQIALAALFTMVAMIFRSHAASIAINLGLIMFVPLLFQLIALILQKESGLADLWLVQNIINLSTFSPLQSDIIKGLIASGVYLVLSTVIGCLAFRKQDIK